MSKAEENERKVLDEKRNVTSRISDTCRFIGFGLLAIYYTIKSGDGAFAQQLKSESGFLVQLVGIAGAAIILLDYLQYLFGYLSIEHTLKRPNVDYDPTAWAYKGRKYAYILKQCATAIGAIALVVLVVTA